MEEQQQQYHFAKCNKNIAIAILEIKIGNFEAIRVHQLLVAFIVVCAVLLYTT
jgi:hypothetical protein